MLTLDPRRGSGDLLRLMMQRGVPCQLREMPYGDASWSGKVADDVPIRIGVELKRVTDVLQCIHDGRFAGHQLVGLLSTYDLVWLLVEGGYRAGKLGVLELPAWRKKRRAWVDYATLTGSTRQYMWRDLQHWLSTMRYRAGVLIDHVYNHDAAADWLAAEYGWWNQPWGKHRAHLALHAGKDIGIGDGAVEIFNYRPNHVGLVSAVLPGIGYEKARAVQKHFKSVRELVGAGVDEWAGILVGKKRLGHVVAQKVVAALNGEGRA